MHGMRKLLLALGLLASSVLVQAQQVELKENHPTTYTVVKGDTLWDISGRFLAKPWLWKEIWHVNPSIKNPNLIYPGDTLTLTYVNGKPRLTVNRGASRGTVKLSPTVRVEPVMDAIPTIPLQSINAFLLKNRVMPNAKAFENVPYVVGGENGSVVSGAGSKVYVRGKLPAGETGFGIYRQAKEFKDPKTNELLGVNADEVATASLVAQQGEVATLNLIRTTQEVRNGDRIFATESRNIDANFQPSSPKTLINAEIIDVPRGVTQVGQTDIVIINKGGKDGLEVGNVLSVYRLGETVKDQIAGGDVKLPDEEAGLLMVFRVYDKLSYGIVLSANRPLSVGDKLKNPQ